MNINLEIGKRIKDLRVKKNLTQLELANALQISAQAVSHWETGENLPDIALFVPLAEMLTTSTDYLLGQYEPSKPSLYGTVLVIQVPGFTNKMSNLPIPEAVIWVNGIYTQVTECILSNSGIPVKYMGSVLLYLFSGPNSQDRAIKAAILSKQLSSYELSIGIHSGDVYFAQLGHPDYLTKDILGTTVNIAFRIEALNSETGIKCSMSVIKESSYKQIKNEEKVELKGLAGTYFVCDVVFT